MSRFILMSGMNFAVRFFGSSSSKCRKLHSLTPDITSLFGADKITCGPSLVQLVHSVSYCSHPYTRRTQKLLVKDDSPRVFTAYTSRFLCTSNDKDKSTTDHTNTSDSDGESSSSDSDESEDHESSPDPRTTPVSDQDVDRELLRYDYEDFGSKPIEPVSISPHVKKPRSVSLTRGITGVFDVEELVNLLRDENGRDICVIRVPAELEYVDYMVLVTGRSTRHLRAMAEYIKWMYKRKRAAGDAASVKIEGEQTNDWFAIDLGNIAVHLFLRKVRMEYDLETLWTVGAEHDEKSRPDILYNAARQPEDFSFDAELERLRQLRAKREGTSAEQEDNIDSIDEDEKMGRGRRSMDSLSQWHRSPWR